MTIGALDALKGIMPKRDTYPDGSRWVHKKSGHVYTIAGRAINESNLMPTIIYHREGEPAVVWLRPEPDFALRFIRLTP